MQITDRNLHARAPSKEKELRPTLDAPGGKGARVVGEEGSRSKGEEGLEEAGQEVTMLTAVQRCGSSEICFRIHFRFQAYFLKVSASASASAFASLLKGCKG